MRVPRLGSSAGRLQRLAGCSDNDRHERQPGQEFLQGGRHAVRILVPVYSVPAQSRNQARRGFVVKIQSGTLYVVATPIGNIDDLSPRAREVLANVSLVAAEDTRHAGQLLTRLGISARLVSLHEHNEAQRCDELLALLKAGEQRRAGQRCGHAAHFAIRATACWLRRGPPDCRSARSRAAAR